MRFVHVAAVAAVALGTGLLGCSTEQQAPPPRAGVTSAQAPQHQLSLEQRARESLLAAEVEINDLQQMSKSTTDPVQRDAIERHIATIRVRRDALLADLSAANGRANDPRLRTGVSNLERAMRAGAATEPQAPSPPPLEQQPAAPGDDEASPPSR